MCLVAVAWRAHPRYPLIVAGNRDERHARPSAPADWWADAAHVVGGRDLVAGGSWLAMSRTGRFAVVINDPRRPPQPAQDASRGHLVRDFVAGERPSGRFLDAVAVAESRYAGFCLVLGTPVQVRGFATFRAGRPHRWTLKAGVSTFSNAPLDEPAPKSRHLEAAVTDLLAADEVPDAGLFALLERREPVAGDSAASVASRTPFVIGESYGTRASTVILVDSERRCLFVERRFDARGRMAGESRVEFALS
jgi:uncharacterized protein with NRDE domain